MNSPLPNQTNFMTEGDDFKKIFARRLNGLLDRRGLPKKSYGRISFLAAALGVSVPTAGRWLSGSVMPDLSKLRAICGWLHCSYEELLGEPGNGGAGRQVSSEFDAEESMIWNHLLAGKAREVRTYHGSELALDPLCLYVLRVTTNIMEPYVVDGDYVVFEPAEHAIRDGVYVLASGSTPLIRRVQTTASGRLKLIVENPRYEDEFVDEMDMVSPPDGVQTAAVIVGRVVARMLVGR